MSSIRTLQKLFTGKRLIIPIGIGLAVAFYFFFKSFDPSAFDSINWGYNTLLWLSLAFVMVLFRLMGYVYRLRILSDRQLSWKSCFQLILLWEFSSAISPGIVGGTAAAFILLAQEKKLNTGQSTAIVMATSYLDVLFYVLCVPCLLIFTGLTSQIPKQIGPFDQSLVLGYFLIAYIFFVAWSSIVYWGLFVKPKILGNTLKLLFRIPFLAKWRPKIEIWSHQIEIAALEFKTKPKSFWLKSFGATLFSWIARFTLVNFLILAFGDGSAVLSIFVKQLIMWGALMIPVTPGASGMAELLFSSFLGEYFSNQSLAETTSVIWRLISYYPYLIAGIIIFPLWIQKIVKQ